MEPSKDQWDDAQAWRSRAGELRQQIGVLNTEVKALKGERVELQVALTAAKKVSAGLSRLLTLIHRELLDGEIDFVLLKLERRRVQVVKKRLDREKASGSDA